MLQNEEFGNNCKILKTNLYQVVPHFEGLCEKIIVLFRGLYVTPAQSGSYQS